MNSYFMNMSKNKYVLFHCHHLSTLYQFIVLKYKYHLYDDVLIMIYNDVFCDSEFAHNLVKNNIFKTIIKAKEPKNFDDLQYEQFVIQYYDKFFLDNHLSFNQIKIIYTAADLNNMFPIYCRSYNKSMIYVEMYNGQFADKSRYNFCTSVFGYPQWLEELYRKYSTLSGDNTKMTSKRYLCPGSIIEYNNKDVIIDFLNEFYSLPIEYKKLVIDCFRNQIKHSSFNNLLIINSPRWTKLYTKLEAPYHYLPYLLISDYYCENDVIIKDHPQAGYYEYFEKEIRPLVDTLPSTIPIEFYGLINGFRINNLISVESSSNVKVEQFIKNATHLGVEFFNNYVFLHRLYTLKFLITVVGGYLDYSYNNYSANLLRKIRFCDKSSFFQTSNRITDSHYIWYIVEETIFNSIQTIFQNVKSNEIFAFFDSWSAKNALSLTRLINPYSQIITIEINKKAFRKNILSDQNKEYIYLLCSDRQIMSIMSTFSLSYRLKYSGLDITAQIV